MADLKAQHDKLNRSKMRKKKIICNEIKKQTGQYKM